MSNFTEESEKPLKAQQSHDKASAAHRKKELRAKQTERIVNKLEAIQNDVLLVVAWQQISDTGDLDLIKAAHRKIGPRMVNSIVESRDDEGSAITEWLDLGLETDLSRLSTC